METIVKNVLTWKKRLTLLLTVLLGVLLSACQETPAAAVMALEEEGGGERHLVKKIFGGVVVEVKHDRSSGRVALTLRRVPVGAGGRPLCRKAAGGLLVVSRVERVFTAAKGRLRSALVVMGDRSRRARRDLAVGQCVTVAPDEDDSERGSVSTRIRILLSRKTHGIRERINAGIVTIWEGPDSFPFRTSRPRSLPPPGRGDMSRGRDLAIVSLYGGPPHEERDHARSKKLKFWLYGTMRLVFGLGRATMFRA